LLVVLLVCAGCSVGRPGPLMPRVAGPWTTIAGNPDLGPLNGPPAENPNHRQEPVDFAMWQATDGS